MPQMAPMNWILLYLMFSITFIMINFLNYYICMMDSPLTQNKIMTQKTLNWKW
uniref:ATP synthase complex subunit 8 n=2 Tax=Carabidae TaxID=41073 RepID=A0A2U8XEC5_9CARA|nr:ATP synthase F0 subunit 8 [Selenophorus alternans]AWN56425.1 ATP synthase F0 subunit 8 [Tetracha sp. DPP-2018]